VIKARQDFTHTQLFIDGYQVSTILKKATTINCNSFRTISLGSEIVLNELQLIVVAFVP